MEKTYVFKLVKPWILIVTTFVVILLLVAVAFPLGKLLSLWTFVVLFSVVFIVLWYYLSHCLLNAEVMVKTDCSGFKIIWLKHFFFHENEDKEYKWNDIESCKSYSDLSYRFIKLQMKNGEKITMYHSILTLNDEFHDFSVEFPDLLGKQKDM